ncbi:MAG: hypothetical protein JWR32_4562 [Mycobacterium sp.]|jgi:GNAT superfamily N-acetyltransferase|nr:hypothetical protein [Mycobacterium sp.]
MPGVITTTNAAVDAPQFIAVHQNDPLASPLMEELAVECSTRYGGSAGQKCSELRAYPAEEFEPPGGALIVAVSKGVPFAGGAFCQYDSITAELKRIWTAAARRQRGYGKLVVAELEQIPLQRGYTRVYLTTGRREPEAVALYLAMGYTPLYDLSLPARDIGPHSFEKRLVCEGAA